MATTVTPTLQVKDSFCQIWKWASIADGDTCLPVCVRGFTDKSVQFSKGSAIGGTITIQGSNGDDVATAVFSTVNDPIGTPLTSSAVAIKQILEACNFLKPVAGTGVAATDIYLFLGTTRS